MTQGESRLLFWALAVALGCVMWWGILALLMHFFAK